MPVNKLQRTTDALPNANSGEWGWLKFVSDVLKFNSDGSNTRSVVTTDQVQTLTNKTVSGAVNSDFVVLAASQTHTSNATPTALSTPFAFTVVPGTYIFEVDLDTTMTTTGGLTVAFVLTTAVLTSIQYRTYAATASDNTTAVSTQGTTATSGTEPFDSKTAAYTYVRIVGSMVVGTGGTFEWKTSQETSASGGDVSVVKLGSFARMTRVA